MARDHAQLQLAIWDDDDFRTLSCSAQHLYFMLLTSPQLSFCGVTDWRPARLAGMVGDWNVDDVLTAAGELIERLYIVVDERTEEVLVRSFVRHDGLMKMPKMATAMATAHAAVGSVPLRQVVVWELQRLHREEPELNGWRSEKASALLAKTSLDPSTYPCGNPQGNPPRNPSGNPPGNPSVYPSGNPKPEGSANPPANPSGNPPASPSSLLLTPNSTPTGGAGGESERPNLSVVPSPPEKSSRRKPQRPLPDDFAITAEMGAWVDQQGLHRQDVVRQTERFKTWCLSKDQRYSDWVQAWRNWINKAADRGEVRRRGVSAAADQAPRYEWEMPRR